MRLSRGRFQGLAHILQRRLQILDFRGGASCQGVLELASQTPNGFCARFTLEAIELLN